MMGTLHQENEDKAEMDDSGCVQDGSPSKKDADRSESTMEAGYQGSAEMMNLSDDVLLYILKWCSPHDLKALGYTCSRLSTLIQDRSLWIKVDARSEPLGRSGFKWLLDNVLHGTTTELLVKGYADEARGCMGHVDREEEEGTASENGSGDAKVKENIADDEDSSESQNAEGSSNRTQPPYPLFRQHARLHINPQQLPRCSGSPVWYEDCASLESECDPPGPCKGPKFTITAGMMRALGEKCPLLTSLSLEYCNINCDTINLGQFPSTLKKLSLRGTKCFNLPLDKSFLFKIQDYLPNLEEVEVSSCEWMEPASLLPLSKLPRLARLAARHCARLTEFVAYASLAARYGFTSLKTLDMRGSPVGDSEVSSLGWCAALQQLYARSPAPRTPHPAHSHPRPRTVQNCTIHNEDDIECPKSNGGHGNDDTMSRDQNPEQVMIEVSLRQREIPPPEREANIEAQRPERDGNIQENGDAPGPSINIRISANNGRNNIVFRRNDIGSGRNDIGNGRNDIGNGRNADENSRNISDDSMSSDEDCDETPQKSVKRKAESVSEEKVKKIKFNNVNEGASTSKVEVCKINNDLKSEIKIKDTNIKIDNLVKDGEPENKNCEPENENSDSENNSEETNEENEPERPKYQNYVRFRQNQSPVVIRYPINERRERNPGVVLPPNLNQAEMVQDNLNQAEMAQDNLNQGGDANQDADQQNNQDLNPNQAPQNQNQGEPRHHILYVNVGQQLHAYYRLPNRPLFHSIRNRNARPNFGCLIYPPTSFHLDPTSLVSDASVHMFGRADGDHVNYINIGPNGPQFGRESNRPNRSNLRVLSLTGYSNITDRSLVHLATAAPYLRLVDFSRTNVTDKGVEQFRSLRPDCEVIYSPFKKS